MAMTFVFLFLVTGGVGAGSVGVDALVVDHYFR
jgi:hypothetical protein